MDDHRKDRLRELIDTKFKGSRPDFIKAAGVSKGRVTQLLDPDVAFGERAARNIETSLGLEDRWFEASRPAPSKQGFDQNVRRVPHGSRAYPVISYIQAGKLKEATEPYPPGAGFDQEFGEDIWSQWTFALEIEGNSMLPEFRPGDRVLIDPDISPTPGDFVAAKNSGHEATFKKYRLRGISALGNQIFELVPLNPDFETLRSDFEPLSIIGVMVEHRRKFKRPRT